MVFAYLPFVFAFLPLFFLTYYAVGHFFGTKGKNVVLFLFSLVFYAWGEPIYIILMFYSTILDYVCGRMIEKGTEEGSVLKKRIFLTISLIGNLGLLSIFKYLGMILTSINSIPGVAIPIPEIIMPIGISFYTFQTMSYSIDVYRGKVKAQKNIINFGAYVAMFPQLIAGPVVRYETVAAELNQRKETLDDFAAGARRFIIGLGKKTLIANIMAQTADALFMHAPSSLGMLGSWVAIIAYTFQIFFDFSGYSDMAIGMGRMMGFHYLENFNYPYIARSVTDFWRRWHISMSTFFRDYIYIPLGGSRVSKPRWLLNIFIVWFATGLWHGASWNFVIWGLYFGLLLVIEKVFLLKLFEHSKVFSHILTLFFVVFGWVIFTQESVGGILEYTKAMFGAYGRFGTGDTNAVLLLQHSDVNTVFLIALAAAVIFSTPIAKKIKEKLTQKGNGELPTAAAVAYDVAVFAILFLCTVQLALGAYNPFIYFRF
ncbi:MAG: MBOAT family protein [Clostridia bacterium]|nr:MBOAT family protein [Clostridia bacterium]